MEDDLKKNEWKMTSKKNGRQTNKPKLTKLAVTPL